MAFVQYFKQHFFLNYESKLNSTQNSYKNYKKFINSKGPRRPKTSPNIKFCFTARLLYNDWLIVLYFSTSNQQKPFYGASFLTIIYSKVPKCDIYVDNTRPWHYLHIRKCHKSVIWFLMDLRAVETKGSIWNKAQSHRKH